jgi:hypothetical protein
MGNVHSISSEAALGGVVILSGVAYYKYTQSPTTHTQQSSNSPASKPSKKSKKKNSKQSTSVQADPSSKNKASATPIVVSFPTVLPGQFDAESIASDEPPAAQSKKSKKKKGKGKDKPTSAGVSSAESSTPVPQSKPKQKRSSPSDPLTSKSTVKSAPLIDTVTDGSWTRVESHNRKAKHAAGGQLQPSLSVTTETETGEESPVTERTDEDKDVRAGKSSNENRRTLAEKLLPKPRKTAVDEYVLNVLSTRH